MRVSSELRDAVYSLRADGFDTGNADGYLSMDELRRVVFRLGEKLWHAEKNPGLVPMSAARCAELMGLFRQLEPQARAAEAQGLPGVPYMKAQFYQLGFDQEEMVAALALDHVSGAKGLPTAEDLDALPSFRDHLEAKKLPEPSELVGVELRAIKPAGLAPALIPSMPDDVPEELAGASLLDPDDFLATLRSMYPEKAAGFEERLAAARELLGKSELSPAQRRVLFVQDPWLLLEGKDRFESDELLALTDAGLIGNGHSEPLVGRRPAKAHPNVDGIVRATGMPAATKFVDQGLSSVIEAGQPVTSGGFSCCHVIFVRDESSGRMAFAHVTPEGDGLSGLARDLEELGDGPKQAIVIRGTFATGFANYDNLSELGIDPNRVRNLDPATTLLHWSVAYEPQTDRLLIGRGDMTLLEFAGFGLSS